MESASTLFYSLNRQKERGLTVHLFLVGNEDMYYAGSTTTRCSCSETNVCMAAQSPLFPVPPDPCRLNTLLYLHYPTFPDQLVSSADSRSHSGRQAGAQTRSYSAQPAAILPGQVLLVSKLHHRVGPCSIKSTTWPMDLVPSLHALRRYPQEPQPVLHARSLAGRVLEYCIWSISNGSTK